MSAAEWSKCSLQCGGGIQTNSAGINRACNIENCNILENNILTDSGNSINESVRKTRDIDPGQFQDEIYFRFSTVAWI